MLVDQRFKRGPSLSPTSSPPHKSPRTHSPSAITPMPDAAEGTLEVEKGETTQGDSLEGTVPGEGPPLSPSARRQSWRRSTMGRRSLSALPNPSQTLCRSISPSLPQQERLEKLMEASMRLTIDRTKKLLQSTPNASLESFQQQVEDMQQGWCCLAKDMRTAMSPKTEREQLPANKANDLVMQRGLEQTQEAIHRLQSETESWEALLNKHRTKSEDLARKVEQGQERGVTLDPASVARSSQCQLIQNKPDYHSILSRQLPLLHTVEMLMEAQCKMVTELLSIQQHSQLLIKETSGRLAMEAGFRDLSPDPIKNLLAAPLSSATS